ISPTLRSPPFPYTTLFRSKKILALETKLAEASRTRVQLRDPIKNYNKMGVRQLQDLTPDWNWSDYFKKINLVEPGDINVHQPERSEEHTSELQSPDHLVCR